MDNLLVLVALHFVTNLKHIKDVSLSWSVKKKAEESKDLVEIELLLADYFNKPGFGVSSEVDNISLVELESHIRKILLDCEREAIQKSRAI